MSPLEPPPNALLALAAGGLLALATPAMAQPAPSIEGVAPFASCAGIDGFYAGGNAWGSISATNGAGSALGSSTTLSNFNSLGFNRRDGRLYVRGRYNGTEDVIALGSDGSYFPLGVDPASLTPPQTGYNAGDVDGDGYLHAMASGQPTVVVIDVTPGRATFGTVTRTYTKASVGADVAWSPQDGLFHGIGGNNRTVITLDPATGSVTSLGDAVPAPAAGLGAQYFSHTGELRIVKNGEATRPIQQVSLVGGTWQVTSTGAVGAGVVVGDGASCWPIVPLAGTGQGASGISAVPTLGTWSLGVLGLLGAALGARRLRKQR